MLHLQQIAAAIDGGDDATASERAQAFAQKGDVVVEIAAFHSGIAAPDAQEQPFFCLQGFGMLHQRRQKRGFFSGELETFGAAGERARCSVEGEIALQQQMLFVKCLRATCQRAHPRR